MSSPLGVPGLSGTCAADKDEVDDLLRDCLGLPLPHTPPRAKHAPHVLVFVRGRSGL